MTLPRSVADVLSRHVLFEVESIDRMYCNLYAPRLQRAEGIVGFIRRHLGQPIASTAAIAPMSRDFVTRLRAFADEHAIPRIDLAKGQRKDDVMHQHLAAFEAAGRREGVLFIGRAREKNTVSRTEKRRGADGRPYPWIVRTTSVVNQFYVHCVDEDFGAFFLKFSSYFPYGAKLLINGHHYAQAQAARGRDQLHRAGRRVRRLRRPARAAGDLRLADEDKIEALARKWLAILPNPYSPADQAAGYRYAISILQADGAGRAAVPAAASSTRAGATVHGRPHTGVQRGRQDPRVGAGAAGPEHATHRDHRGREQLHRRHRGYRPGRRGGHRRAARQPRQEGRRPQPCWSTASPTSSPRTGFSWSTRTASWTTGSSRRPVATSSVATAGWVARSGVGPAAAPSATCNATSPPDTSGTCGGSTGSASC